MGRFKRLVELEEAMEKFIHDYRIPSTVGLRYCKEGDWHITRREDEVVISGYIAENNPVLGEPRSRKGKVPCHQGSLLEHPKGKPKRSGPAIGAWWRSNPKKGCHIRIKYPKLTF